MVKIKSLMLFSLLIFNTVLYSQTNTSASDVLDKVRQNLTSLSANFQQYEVDANDRKSEVSTGIVWLRAPDQFKWQYQKPIAQLISADGNQVWVYDEDLEQVTVKQQRSQQNPIYVLLNKELSEKNYQITYDESAAKEGSDDEQKDKVQWVKMIPNQPSDEVKIVWLGIKNEQLSVLKLQNQLDNLVVFEFDDIKRNPPLTDDFFTFIAPKGTDIISESAGIGEF